MAKALEIVRLPVLVAKDLVRPSLKRLPLPALFILGSVLLGILAIGVPIIAIKADIHFDTVFGYTRQSRTLSDDSKFVGMLWLGLCASFVGAAGAWVACDKFRWAMAVPICYAITFMAIWAAWRYGGF
ncbi:hypothetical protein HY442_01805 [Candidatus Parcubacteria bacterium]|nr:hypothetical protein [Candidatus Parcubacteria bacterium]